MSEHLELTSGKFTFRVATDRLYTPDGEWAVWTKLGEATHVRLGLADYLQQHSGDVAFVTVRPAGTQLAAAEDFAELETVKVTIGLPSPVSGIIVEINKDLEMTPEVVNQDPYGKGWLAVIEATNWETDCAKLLKPHEYLKVVQSQVEQETRES